MKVITRFNPQQYAKQLGMDKMMKVSLKNGFSGQLFWAENKAYYVYEKNGGMFGGGRVLGDKNKVNSFIAGVLNQFEGIAEPGVNVWKNFAQATLQKFK